MKKLDLTVVICDLKNKALTEAGAPLTLGAVLGNSLLSQPQHANPSADEKYKRFKLASKIATTSELEASADDIVLLKRVVGELYTALIVGRVFDLLEGTS
jgi:hypothetical protein